MPHHNKRHSPHNTCIIHCRVSTPKQAYEGESLDVQTNVCAKIAEQKGWTLVHEPWKEGYSGRKDNRPVFKNILEFLDEHPGSVRYYVFRSIDRFTRRGSFTYEEMKRELTSRGVELIDSYGIIQPVRNTLEDVGFEYDWSKVSPSAISELVIAAASNAEVTSILTRTISQEIRLTQRGYRMRQANDGLENVKIEIGGRKYTVQQPHPERAKYLLAAYDLRAAGRLTDEEICKHINAMGYRTRLHKRWDASHQEVVGRVGGRPLTVKRLQAMIARPIYCGVICETWTRWKPVRTAYPGLVSIKTFNAANREKVYIQECDGGKLDILYDWNPAYAVSKRNRHNPDFPFRGVVLCHQCRKPLVGSSPRGKSGKRFPTYHCSRRHKYWGVSKAVLDAAVSKTVCRLSFRPGAVPPLHEWALRKYEARKAEIRAADAHIEQSVAELELRKAEAVRAFKLATTDAMRQSLEIEATELGKQIESAGTVRASIPVTEDDIAGYMRCVRRTMEHPTRLLKHKENATLLRASYSLVFSPLPTWQEIANGTPKLRWIFSLSSGGTDAISQCVTPAGFDWNTIEESILDWKRDAPLHWQMENLVEREADQTR